MKRLTAIRTAKTWQERLDLAQNKHPGTKFDEIFHLADKALKLIDSRPGADDFQHLVDLTNPALGEKADMPLVFARQTLERIGEYFARLFQRGDSHTVDELSEALNIWRHHRPNLAMAGRIRAELIALNGMFPPGKPRLKKVGNKIVEGKPWPTLKSRDVLENLELHGTKITENNRPGILREIRRQAKDLNIIIDSTPGRPGKSKGGQKHIQKP